MDPNRTHRVHLIAQQRGDRGQWYGTDVALEAAGAVSRVPVAWVRLLVVPIGTTVPCGLAYEFR